MYTLIYFSAGTKELVRIDTGEWEPIAVIDDEALGEMLAAAPQMLASLKYIQAILMDKYNLCRVDGKPMPWSEEAPIFMEFAKITKVIRDVERAEKKMEEKLERASQI